MLAEEGVVHYLVVHCVAHLTSHLKVLPGDSAPLHPRLQVLVQCGRQAGAAPPLLPLTGGVITEGGVDELQVVLPLGVLTWCMQQRYL